MVRAAEVSAECCTCLILGVLKNWISKCDRYGNTDLRFMGQRDHSPRLLEPTVFT